MKSILSFLGLAVVCGAGFAAVCFAGIYLLFGFPMLTIFGMAGLCIAAFIRGVGSNTAAEDNGW